MQNQNRFLAMLLASTLVTGIITGNCGIKVSAAEKSELTESVYTQAAEERVFSDADIKVTEKTAGSKTIKFEETQTAKKVTAEKAKQDKYYPYYDKYLKAKESKYINKEIVETENYVFVVNDDGTLTVSSYSGTDSIVNIPEEVDGLKVTAIDDWAFFGNDSIEEINIPKTLKGVMVYCGEKDDDTDMLDDTEPEYDEIDMAASYSYQLQKNDIVGGYIIVADSAPFFGCSNLKKINVDPDNPYYTSIDGVLFTYVKYMGNQEDNTEKDQDKLVLVQYPDGKQDFDYYIPENTAYIGSSLDKDFDDVYYTVYPAFYDNDYTFRVHIPDSIEFIGINEFFYYLGILYGGENTVSYQFAYDHGKDYYVVRASEPNTDLDFEYLVSCVYSDEHPKCAVIMRYVGKNPVVTIPNEINGLAVEVISNKAFYHNQVITEANLPNTINYIELINTVDDYDGSEPITEVATIANSIAPFFLDCPNLQSINVEEGSAWYKSVDGVLFSRGPEKDDKNTVLVTYPQSKPDEQYTVSRNVRDIGMYLMSWEYELPFEAKRSIINNPYLKKITIPDSVKTIYDGELSGCDLTIRGYEGSFAQTYAFCNNIPFEAMDYDPDIDYSEIFEYEVDVENTIIITKYIGNESNLRIPNIIDGMPVTVISNRAFADCSVLREVFLPKFFMGVEIINTLYDDVDLDDDFDIDFGTGSFIKKHFVKGSKDYTSITAIGASPFGNCENLESIEVDPMNEYYVALGGILYTYVKYAGGYDDAEDKDMLALLKYPQNSKNIEFTVPSFVKYIGTDISYAYQIRDPYKAYAFYGCRNLEYLTVPREVQFIREGELSDKNTTLFVYDDSYAYKYAVSFDLPYELLGSHADTDQPIYGETEAAYTIEYENGIGGALFDIYYDAKTLMLDSITGYDETKYSVIVNDDLLGKVSVNVICLTDDCDTKLTFVFNFKVIKEVVGYDIYGEICELVDKDTKEVNEPDNYGKLTIDGEEIKSVTDTDIDYTIEHEGGIGGVLFKVYYDDDVFEYADISGFDNDQYSVIANDDRLGTVSVNAISLKEECPDKVTFTLHFIVIKEKAYAYQPFNIVLEELIDTDANDVNDPQNYGDVNMDGKVTAKDSMSVQRYVIQLENLTDEQQKRADVDLDGKITSKDALYILQASINMRSLPVSDK